MLRTAVARLGFKRRAKVEFNSINLVRHGSSTTFETGLLFIEMLKIHDRTPLSNDLTRYSPVRDAARFLIFRN